MPMSTLLCPALWPDTVASLAEYRVTTSPAPIIEGCVNFVLNDPCLCGISPTSSYLYRCCSR